MNQFERGNITTTTYSDPWALMRESATKVKVRKKIVHKPLVWNVFYEDFNARRIVTYNIFNHGGFYDDCCKAAKLKTKEEFEEAVKRSMRYYYWSKCEWEIILTAWPPRENFHDEKIDVYDQVMMNWDVFIDHLWENRGALHARQSS